MKLKELNVGARATIMGLAAATEKVYRHQLLAMGLTPGTELLVSRIAPLGDPVEIIVRGVALSLRKNEADLLLLQEIIA